MHPLIYKYLTNIVTTIFQYTELLCSVSQNYENSYNLSATTSQFDISGLNQTRENTYLAFTLKSCHRI